MRRSEEAISPARASISDAALDAASACEAVSLASRSASALAWTFSRLESSSAKAFASSDAWYTIALYVADHVLFSCEGWESGPRGRGVVKVRW